MNPSPSYPLRWRGIQSGPFSIEAIQRMLDEGQICLWHEVLVNGRWTIVEDLLKVTALSTATGSAKAPSSEGGGKSTAKTLPRMR